MKNNITLIIFTLSMLLPVKSHAANPIDSLQLKVRVGYSIGGTAPIGIPATIRSLDAFRLTPSLMVGMDVLLPMQGKWGMLTGLRFENKGMDADVTTKRYHMELVKGDSRVEGLFTGKIKQEVTEWMLTLPIQATYKMSDKVLLKGGPYVSYLISKDFSGIASDGYLREGNPTGVKIVMGDKEGEWATYDFSDKMRNLQLGIGAGVDWQPWTSIGVSADLNWGLTGIFKSSFKTVEQTLYPIYGTVSVFYRIR